MDLGENSKVFTVNHSSEVCYTHFYSDSNIFLSKTKLETQCYQILNNERNESDLKQLEIEESISNIRKNVPITDNPTEFPNKVSSFISTYSHIKFCLIISTSCVLNKHFSLDNLYKTILKVIE